MKKRVEHLPGDEVVWDDYPVGKYAKKIDWWTSKQGIELISSWRQEGASIKDIYEKIGVDVRTFRSWRQKCPDLEEALVVGKEITNARVIDALYKRAVGFYYDEEQYDLVEGEMMLTRRYRRYCPPDTKAILSWLFNRYPQEWRAIQAPIDADGPALQNAEDVLVKIRDAALSLPDASSLASEKEGGLTPDENGEGQEKPQENAEENNQ